MELICSDWSNVKTLIIQLYLLSIVCSWLNSLISLILTLMFALIGNDQTILYRLLEFLARFCHLLAQILFLFALILSVNGYFINRIQWRRKPMIQIQIFMFLYTVIQIIIIILMTIVSGIAKTSRWCLSLGDDSGHSEWESITHLWLYSNGYVYFDWILVCHIHLNFQRKLDKRSSIIHHFHPLVKPTNFSSIYFPS